MSLSRLSSYRALRTLQQCSFGRRYASAEFGKDTEKTAKAAQDAKEQRHTNLAKMLTQTENPAVLRTVTSVLKGIQGIFGGGSKADSKTRPKETDKSKS